jgi:membrane fusion protein, multidrug efflux system
MTASPAHLTGGLAPRPAQVALLALALISCGGGDPGGGEGARRPPTPVRTTRVSPIRQVDWIRGSGTVASRAEMSLAFRIPGYVAEVLVDEGDRVSAGQVLARLRTDEVDAGVRSAGAQAELAARSLERIERLFTDSVVTLAMLDEARDAHERAQAGLEVALFNQMHATIRAPGPGRVLRRMIEVSEFIGAGVPAVRLSAANSPWVVRLGVADRQVVSLSLADAAEVTLAALPGETLPGRVTQISDAADPRSGTFEVEITMEGGGGRLRSGMVAQVAIAISDPDELSFLPLQALIDVEGLEGAVFVLEDGLVRRHPVSVVRIGAESVGVRAPELVGATIVTDGAANLRDGDQVEDRTADLPLPGS